MHPGHDAPPSALAPSPVARRGRRSRGRGARVASAAIVALVVGAAGTAGALVAAKRAVDTVARTDAVSGVLDTSSPTVENFLLVGSDSRAGADPNDPDYGGIGSATDVTGNRSDTIMVLRRDRATGDASLLSIPRDLWVDIAGGGTDRINSAFNDGPATLVQTVQDALGIPIHHYLEIDFFGFKDLVDSLGGVQICFLYPTRDTNTGLNITEPGCHLLDGVQALAYARSRHYEELRDGDWHEDGTADLGRTQRQRDFVNRALHAALDEVAHDPFRAGDVLRAASSALTVDDGLDLVGAAASLRSAVSAGLATYALPVEGRTIDGKSVLLLADGADSVLSYFRGDGPAPLQEG